MRAYETSVELSEGSNKGNNIHEWVNGDIPMNIVLSAPHICG